MTWNTSFRLSSYSRTIQFLTSHKMVDPMLVHSADCVVICEDGKKET
jgi:hypothetical protein